jgi:hypothetical protein
MPVHSPAQSLQRQHLAFLLTSFGQLRPEILRPLRFIIHRVYRPESGDGRLLAVPRQRLELAVFLLEPTHEDGAAVLFADVLQGAQQQRALGGANQGNVLAQVLQVTHVVKMGMGKQHAMHLVQQALPVVKEVVFMETRLVDAVDGWKHPHHEQLIQPTRLLRLDELFVVVHQTAEVLPKVQPQGEVAVL